MGDVARFGPMWEKNRVQGIDRRLAIHRYISKFEDEHKYSPSIGELCQEFGLARSTVWHHLLTMRSAGLVDWLDGQPRTLHVLGGIDSDA